MWRIGCHFKSVEMEIRRILRKTNFNGEARCTQLSTINWIFISKIHSFASRPLPQILVRCNYYAWAMSNGSTRSNQHPWLPTNRNYDYITRFKCRNKSKTDLNLNIWKSLSSSSRAHTTILFSTDTIQFITLHVVYSIWECACQCNDYYSVLTSYNCEWIGCESRMRLWLFDCNFVHVSILYAHCAWGMNNHTATTITSQQVPPNVLAKRLCITEWWASLNTYPYLTSAALFSIPQLMRIPFSEIYKLQMYDLLIYKLHPLEAFLLLFLETARMKMHSVANRVRFILTHRSINRPACGGDSISDRFQW